MRNGPLIVAFCLLCFLVIWLLIGIVVIIDYPD